MWVLFGAFKLQAGICQTKENFGSTLEWELRQEAAEQT